MACDELPNNKPYWNYEDIGIFFLVLVLIGFVLRLLVRFHLLARSELRNPSVLLQFLAIASLTLALYLVLKLRHHRPVLHPLGWIWPRPVYVTAGPLAGVLLASARCALFAPLPPQSAADEAYGTAVSGRFTRSDS